MATHSSVLAWRTPGTAEPDGLSSVASHRLKRLSSSSHTLCFEDQTVVNTRDLAGRGLSVTTAHPWCFCSEASTGQAPGKLFMGGRTQISYNFYMSCNCLTLKKKESLGNVEKKIQS